MTLLGIYTRNTNNHSTMKKIRHINLEFSCPESIDSMDATQREFNCSKCSREVIDFSGKSGTELQQIISKSPGSVCGIFKRSQMSQSFLKYAAATILATASTSVAKGQETINSEHLEIVIDSLGEEEEEELFIGTIMETQAEPIGGFQKFMDMISKSSIRQN